jgi:NADPH2:quinone reductase
VLIDVEAISVEGGDLLHRAYSPLPRKPHVVGYACAGTIRAIGANVKGRAVGDRVATLSAAGSHAERRAVPAALTWPIPVGLAADVAACVPVAVGTAAECLFTAGGLSAGQSVLIQAGAGGVGMAAIQLAKRAGATVIATSSSDEKLARLTPLGMDHGIDYRKQDFVQEVRRITAGRGVDIVLDSVGGKVLVESVRALVHRGRLVSVGVAGRAGSSIEAMSLWARCNSLHGVYLAGVLEAEYARGHALITQCLERVASGEIQVVIDATFSLKDAAKAHARAEDRATFGRVILVP